MSLIALFFLSCVLFSFYPLDVDLDVVELTSLSAREPLVSLATTLALEPFHWIDSPPGWYGRP